MVFEYIMKIMFHCNWISNLYYEIYVNILTLNCIIPMNIHVNRIKTMLNPVFRLVRIHVDNFSQTNKNQHYLNIRLVFLFLFKSDVSIMSIFKVKYSC